VSVLQGIGHRDGLGGERHHRERAHQVDVDDLGIERQVVDAFATEDPSRRSDAGTVDGYS
jgi:hypothetical protein